MGHTDARDGASEGDGMSERMTLDELLDMIDHLKSVIAALMGEHTENLPGFPKCQSRLVRCLLAAEGAPVSFNGLLEAVYFDRPVPKSRAAIRGLVTYIRNKLRRPNPPLNARLHTVSGGFYRLEMLEARDG